jgi:hypothetical protein
MAKITKTQISKEQKKFLSLIKSMPKVTNRSTNNQLGKLFDWFTNNFRLEVDKQSKILERDLKLYFRELKDTSKPTTLSERQPGWHKEHYNYNKAEKWELPPSLRRTPARNVTKTGAKRKRATTITKYKR